MTGGRGLVDTEPHLIPEEDFYRQVQSFSYWFETVEGYLSGRPFGSDPDLVEEPVDGKRRERIITTLCNYCVGEAAALEASSAMVRSAPNHNSRIFMATQVADEARHLEVFLHRLSVLGVDDPEAEVRKRAHPSLVAFKDRLVGMAESGDWNAAVFAQNVVLETMEFTVFRHHATTADPVTRQVLVGVISDERRHLGFGENDLGRRLVEDKAERSRLEQLKVELDALVIGSLEGAYDDLGMSRQDRPAIGRDYLEAVERLGLVQ